MIFKKSHALFISWKFLKWCVTLYCLQLVQHPLLLEAGATPVIFFPEI